MLRTVRKFGRILRLRFFLEYVDVLVRDVLQLNSMRLDLFLAIHFLSNKRFGVPNLHAVLAYKI
jgi:hypothetical protein